MAARQKFTLGEIADALVTVVHHLGVHEEDCDTPFERAVVRLTQIAQQQQQDLDGVRDVLDHLIGGGEATAGRDFGRGVAHAARLIERSLVAQET